MTTNSTLNWNAMRDGKGYWACADNGDYLTIWGRSKDREGFTVNVNGEVPVSGVTLREAKAAAEQWVADQQPKMAPVTAGAWSIDDAGNLWKDGEYIGRIVEEQQRGTDNRRFHAQGVDIVESGKRYDHNRRYMGIGSSSARTITTDEHAEWSAKVQ